MKKFFIPLSCFFILFATQSHAVLDVAGKTKAKPIVNKDNRYSSKEQYNFGVEEYEKGDLLKAEYWLRKAIKKGSAEARDLLSTVFFDLGENSLEAGKKKEANGFFEKVAQLGDKNVLISIADIYLEMGEELEAIEWLKKAVAYGSVEALAEIGYIHLNNGEKSEAIEWLEKAAEKGDSVAFFWIGDIHLKSGEKSKAIESLEKAAELGSLEAKDKLEEIKQNACRSALAQK